MQARGQVNNLERGAGNEDRCSEERFTKAPYIANISNVEMGSLGSSIMVFDLEDHPKSA